MLTSSVNKRSNPWNKNHTRIVLFVPILTCISLVLFRANASDPSYNVYNYDLTNPLFTPDGFIKQVEYASDAASQSSPMIVLPFMIPSSTVSMSSINLSHDDDDDQEIVENRSIPDKELAFIVASITPNRRKEYNYDKNQEKQQDEDDDEEEDKRVLHEPKRYHRGQRRIVTIPISLQPSYLSDHASTSSNHIILGLNGILPDCMELVSLARDHLVQRTFASYGIHTLHHSSMHSSNEKRISSPFMGTACSTVFRLAQFISSKCQERAFGGGIRPFGSTIVLCGIDSYPTVSSFPKQISTLNLGKDISIMKICVVDPSGKITSLDYNIPTNNTTTIIHDDSLFIIGGKDESVRDNLRQHAQNYISSHIQTCSNSIRLHLEATLHAFLAYSLSENKNKPLRSDVDTMDPLFKYNRRQLLRNYDIELILSTPYGGIQYLSEDQIETLLQKIK